MLTARKPDIATDDPHLAWSTLPEFAHIYNGASAVIPYVEHYLNHVMATVRDQHCGDNAALAAELDQFIRQEATHARYHALFNKRMFGAGYDGLKTVIDQAVGDLQRMKATRSLAFNVAYCAGFETTATFSAKFLLERCFALFKAGDAYGANLLQWHVAEEFEHRATCHAAFAQVSGNYLVRLAGLAYSFWHINMLFGRAANIVMAVHRADMTAVERRASVRAEKRIVRRQMAYMLPRMVRLLQPYYDPARLAVPPRIAQALDYFRRHDPIRVSFADAVEGG